MDPGYAHLYEQTAIVTHPFFKDMAADHLAILESLSMAVHFDSNEMIFHQGELANRFYLLITGRVSLETSVPGKGMVVVDEIVGGDVLGWSWLFEPYEWNFDARALSPTSAWFIYGTRLRETCDSDPSLGYDIMTRVSAVVLRRLQATRKRMVAFAKLVPDFLNPYSDHMKR